MDNIKIGLFLQSLRKSKGITQAELADEFNISNKTVSKWECGETLPEIPLLKSLADYYGVTVDEILNGESNKTINIVVKEEKKSDDKKFNLSSIISISITYFIFLISLAIGYGINKGVVAGFIGLLGGLTGISTYFIFSYVFDKGFYKKIKEYKNNILISISVIIFEIILSILVMIPMNMILPKILISDILRTISVYGFVSLFIYSIINKKYELSSTFVFLIILNLLLNFIPLYSYYEDFDDDFRNICSGYHNVFRSWYGLFIIPLLLNILIFVLSILTINNIIDKKYLNIIIFIMLFMTALVAFILEIDVPKDRKCHTGYIEYKIYPTRYIIYGFIISYLGIFGYLYRNNKELIIDTFVFVIFNILLFALIFNYQDTIDVTNMDNRKKYYELFSTKPRIIALLSIQLVVYLISIILFVVFKMKNKMTFISYILLMIILLSMIYIPYMYLDYESDASGIDDLYIGIIILELILIFSYILTRLIYYIKHLNKNENGQIE